MARPGLSPLDPASRALARFVGRAQSPAAPGLLALRHALARGLPGFWGDDPAAPGSVLFVRAGADGLEAFGLGDPEPAVSWLAGREAAVALAAPADWRRPAEGRVHGCRCGTVVTCGRPPFAPGRLPRAAVPARRLSPADEAAFTAAAPEWALRGWGEFPALVTLGAAFGVPEPHGGRFAALAWVFDATDRYDALAAFTAPRFRRLGLGRAAALALLEHVRQVRRKAPLWSASADNAASLALAASLGFVPAAFETVLRWPAQTPGAPVTRAGGFGMM